ncbi:MAG: rhodanese-like domain-containing protein [Bacteroidota bacterium]
MREITAIELHAQLQQQEIYLLDVREPYEHEDFNIGGELIPLDEVMSKASNIPKDKPVIVYCKKGIRSQIAIQRLQEKFGFTNLVNLKGGMDAWKKSVGSLKRPE